MHVGLWPTAIKLNPLWKTEVNKSAWIKPWLVTSCTLCLNSSVQLTRYLVCYLFLFFEIVFALWIPVRCYFLYCLAYFSAYMRNQIFLCCSDNEILCVYRAYGASTAASNELMLIITGNVELYPRLWASQYPCGECGNAVTMSGTACDICNTWHQAVNMQAWR